MIGRRRRTDPAVEAEQVAADLDRLGALIAAGASQRAAWEHLARTSADSAAGTAALVAAAAEHGRPLAAAFRDASDAWRAAGAVVALAAETGAPLAAAVRTAATGARRTAELHRAVAASMAGPVASARLVLLLPPATALLGWAFGFDVPRVLVSPPGALALLIGGGLLAAAAVWSRRLIRDARRTTWTAGLDLELVRTAVGAGLPVSTARRLAAEAAEGTGAVLEPSDELEAVLRFAATAGLPVVALLAAEADRVRGAALAAARIRAEVLAVRLLLPLGLLVLPSFLVLGALPVGLAVLSSTAVPL
ncbi:type II secretion system F family protein [Amnibacterium kyonggiense]|uniref:Tight adherence protein B n=1 Tax=Amnibacterium kyonggiense TaxID=595671 RepID=A0A4R7FF20_9MICO|nr:type II secretion system F family protein [Amnibacterium kyonggiense]TDS75066.1 tight adherence protein B [Amnibacterium kyonggiense]